MAAKSAARPKGSKATAKPKLALADAVNDACPWSGDPVRADSLTLYKGEVVGFCNPGCRDKFERAAHLFDTSIETRAGKRARAGRSLKPGATRMPGARQR